MVPMWVVLVGLAIVGGVTAVVHAFTTAKIGAESMLKNYRSMLAESREKLIKDLEKEAEENNPDT